ncbi:MAG: hypothetical protein AAFQ43_11855, partial [Bacteroidota bacterium]
MRLLALAALIAVPVLVSAQDIVQLRGWGLDEGTEICGTGEHIAHDRLTDDAGGEIMRSQMSYVVGACFLTAEVEDGLLLESVERYTPARGSEKGWQYGELVYNEPLEHHYSDVRTRVIRDGDSWRRENARGWPDSPRAQAAREGMGGFFDLDDAVYPAEPVAVGDSWDIPQHLIRGMVASMDTSRAAVATMRLDSLGTIAGHPVAYVSYEAILTAYGPYESLLNYRETGIRIRRLDDLFDIYIHRTVDQGADLRAQY